MTTPRGVRLLVAAATVIGGLLLAPAADAQVFKPRSKTAAIGKSNTAAARKASPAPSATASKKPARTEPTRKAKTTKKRHKPRGDDDVKIQDDDDDVKITDD
ncbi:MAG TPA: hypothetical protein VLM79_33875 [Kofleriaceae bacterium]|nr:hypothetical protein [Kofleriaceae bacterium]